MVGVVAGRRWLVLLVFAFVALAACGGNGDRRVDATVADALGDPRAFCAAPTSVIGASDDPGEIRRLADGFEAAAPGSLAAAASTMATAWRSFADETAIADITADADVAAAIGDVERFCVDAGLLDDAPVSRAAMRCANPLPICALCPAPSCKESAIPIMGC